VHSCVDTRADAVTVGAPRAQEQEVTGAAQVLDELDDSIDAIGGNATLSKEHLLKLVVVIERKSVVVGFVDDHAAALGLPDTATTGARHGAEEILLGYP